MADLIYFLSLIIVISILVLLVESPLRVGKAKATVKVRKS
jgi:hypothetical protein